MNQTMLKAKRWLAGRTGRRAMKLLVVTCGVIWCSSWPGLIGGDASATLAEQVKPTAQRLAAIAELPDCDLGRLTVDEASQRVRALLTRRAPGDLDRAQSMLERALAKPPAERARRRGLERLAIACRRLKREEEALCHPEREKAPQSLALSVSNAWQAAMPGPKPTGEIR